MLITNATDLRKNLFAVLDATIVNDEKIIVTTKNGNLAIISEEYLRTLEESCRLYSIPGVRESIVKEANTPINECVEVDWRNALK